MKEIEAGKIEKGQRIKLVDMYVYGMPSRKVFSSDGSLVSHGQTNIVTWGEGYAPLLICFFTYNNEEDFNLLRDMAYKTRMTEDIKVTVECFVSKIKDGITPESINLELDNCTVIEAKIVPHQY